MTGPRGPWLCPVWLGRCDYDEVHRLQIGLRDEIAAGPAPTTLLLLEHQPVITLGRKGDGGDLLATPEELAAQGIALRWTERGGGATYHGPGQLVGYLIGRARDLAPDLPTLVERIEAVMLEVCRRLGVPARRDPRQRGVWAGPAKLGFVGVAVSRGVCWHGFALNVDLDLEPFRLIRPCGLDDEITSIARCGGRAPSVAEVAQLAATQASETFTSPHPLPLP